jgi:hypothetical protein
MHWHWIEAWLSLAGATIALPFGRKPQGTSDGRGYIQAITQFLSERAGFALVKHNGDAREAVVSLSRQGNHSE